MTPLLIQIMRAQARLLGATFTDSGDERDRAAADESLAAEDVRKVVAAAAESAERKHRKADERRTDDLVAVQSDGRLRIGSEDDESQHIEIDARSAVDREVWR